MRWGVDAEQEGEAFGLCAKRFHVAMHRLDAHGRPGPFNWHRGNK